MKTHALTISAVILIAFAGSSLAETSAPLAKPSTVQSPALATAPDAAKGVKAIDDAAAKAHETQEASKQTLKDVVTSEDKTPVKAAEEGLPKTPSAAKAADSSAKASKHSAEKAVEKVK